jgi:hypothetical protein
MGVVQDFIDREPTYKDIGSALTEEIKKQLLEEAKLEYAFTSLNGKLDAILAVQQAKMKEALARNQMEQDELLRVLGKKEDELM